MRKVETITALEAFRTIDTGMLTYEEAESIKALIERQDKAVAALERDMEVATGVLQEIHLLGCQYGEDRCGRWLNCFHLRPPASWCAACIAEAYLNGMPR